MSTSLRRRKAALRARSANLGHTLGPFRRAPSGGLGGPLDRPFVARCQHCGNRAQFYPDDSLDTGMAVLYKCFLLRPRT